ncbi:MAG TPA: hypothetical protein VKT22_01195 [Steroidobacteraceae bacterium]|nr:hypothetical protein [Steroidobacteraceae bacterium]
MNRREAELPEARVPHALVPQAPVSQAMERRAAAAALERALLLSHEIAALAERGDAVKAASLDVERRALLVSSRPVLWPLAPHEAAMLRQIAELNDRSIGRLEHCLRATCRDLDMLSVGRRALRAYGAHRP